jgi:UPF0755 protein
MTQPSGSDDRADDPYDAAPEPVDLKGRTRVQRIVRRIEITLILGILIVAIAAAGVGYWGWTRHTEPGPLAVERTVLIPQGAGVRRIAATLAREGVIATPELFTVMARLTGLHGRLKAGEYSFEPGIPQQAVLAKLVSGETVDRFVTLPEGLTSAEIVALINAAPGLAGTLETVPAEGTLLPETYHYEYGAERARILERMRGSMQETLARLWETRAPGLPFETPREAVVLASIVEKETGVESERAKVAGVFINRLERGMRLQSDPTVVYALTEGRTELDRALTRKDWQFDHPYNTYRIDGLPPGPIANPGRASLEAVLQPEETDALYFVADGSGGHAFARTLEEHNRNVAKWRRIRDSRD